MMFIEYFFVLHEKVRVVNNYRSYRECKIIVKFLYLCFTNNLYFFNNGEGMIRFYFF